MDWQQLIQILDSHEGTVEVPLEAIYSAPLLPQVQQILGSKLILKSPIKREPGDMVRTIVATGGSGLFDGMTVTVSFSAAAIRRLSINAVTTSTSWTVDKVFPKLRHTLASALEFKKATWSLAVDPDSANPLILKLSGTLNTNSSLGLLAFLVGKPDEEFTGAIEIDNQGIPKMHLASSTLEPGKLDFLPLGPTKLTLISDSVPGPTAHRQVTQPTAARRRYPTARMELSSSILFKRQEKQVPLPLKASIYSASSIITIDADTTALSELGLHELSALLNDIPLKLDVGDFELEKAISLKQLTFVVDPQSTTKLISAAFTIKSCRPWPILKDREDKSFLEVGEICVSAGISAPFSASDIAVALRGEIKVSTARIIIEAMFSGSNVALHGYLEPDSSLCLRDVATLLLGKNFESYTPALRFGSFDLYVEPDKSYRLQATLDDLWTIHLTEKANLHIEKLWIDWEYKKKAVINGRIQLGGVVIELYAENESDGWTFKGNLAAGKSINISDLLDDVYRYFGLELPGFLQDITLNTLSVDRFNPSQKSFHFTIGGTFKVADDKSVHVEFKARIENSKGKFVIGIDGCITVGNLNFEMHFARDPKATCFIASYQHGSKGCSGAKEEKQPEPIDLRQFISEHLSPSIGNLIPATLKVDMKDLLFGITSVTDERTKFLFALDLSASANLSSLPLVGEKFPKDQTVGVDGLRLVVVGPEGLTEKELNAFNALLPDGIKKLTVATDAAKTASDTDIVMPKGLAVSAVMNYGGTKHPLSLPVRTEKPPAHEVQKEPSASPVPVTSSDDAKWFTLQKSFGPVSLEKIGVMYKNENVWFLLNASLSAAGLTLTLDGLGFHSPIKSFDLHFDLNGLGISYKGANIEIGGALLKIPKPDPKVYEYAGTAFIKTQQLTISAIGSFMQMDHDMSLFVYARLNYPIGGPSFFFVTGLAAGFGYNRNLKVPEVENIADFPLIADAIAGDKGPVDIRKKLQSLDAYIKPMVGQYFLAVGIKFTSFKVVDSFALLTVTFGRRFELNVLGLSTLIMPTPVKGELSEKKTRLAQVQMALKATYIPDEGFLGVSAQLTSESFILSKDCHLTGGFAFYSWFSGEHAGDFVLSLGGYHPDYKPPAHYPKVPRIGFDWRVNEQLHIKGAGYYAMTPAVLMAGGSLQATWESTNLRVWFKLEANFIITWKPYHYDARMYVDLGISYTFQFLGTQHINVNVGADLQLWGPEFSGTAHVQLWVISFDITFGAGAPKTAEKIDWPTFKASFLPQHDQICTITIKEGLISDSKNGGWVVNPKEFAMVTNSMIPITKADLPGLTWNDAAGSGPGIAPMAVNTYVSNHVIKITKLSETKDVNDQFEFKAVTKKVPVGIWGRSFKPSMGDPAFIDNTLAGIEIRPKFKFDAGASATLKPGVLLCSCERGANFKWESRGNLTDDKPELAIEAAVAASEKDRTKLLKDLNVETKRSVSSKLSVVLFDSPQIGPLVPKPNL